MNPEEHTRAAELRGELRSAMNLDEMITPTEIRRVLRRAKHHAIKRVSAYALLALGFLTFLAVFAWAISNRGNDNIVGALLVTLPAAMALLAAYFTARLLLLSTAGGELSREDEDALRQTLAALENGRPRT